MGVYDALMDKMKMAYAKAGIASISGYQTWYNAAKTPYVSDTHAGRYVNNFVNARGAAEYAKFEDGGLMPIGTVIAKDSFGFNAKGKAEIGPIFIMEKMAAGNYADTADWRYSMIMPDGNIFGVTKGINAAGMTFCHECHEAAEDNDYQFFLPEDDRN
jgi:hypothetical protein